MINLTNFIIRLKNFIIDTKKKTNVKKTNFTNYYNKAVKIYSKEEILINIHILLLFLNEIVGNPEDVTIIGIGDSPAILLQIYKIFLVEKYPSIY